MPKNANFILKDGATGDIKDIYVVGDQIGQPGQFGCAHRVQRKKDGAQFAAKRIAKTKFEAKDRSFHFKQFGDEIKIMQSLKHQNIIQIVDTFEDVRNLWIVMELCEGGELFDRIKSQPNGNFSELDASGILRQMAEGIRYLHEHKIAHCDLKPDNFLFLNDKPDSPLKIIDFGMSKMVSKPWKFLTTFRGTPYYVAPEVLQGKYLMHCDMWSFGVVAFVMLFGFPPFHDENDDRLFKKIQKGFTPEVKRGYGAWFPESIPTSDAARDLISRCLTMDTSVRLTASEVLEHKWFTGGASDSPLEHMLKNLQDFTSKASLKGEVLAQMVNVMSNEDIAALRDQFKKLDKNGDGFISKEELAEGLGATAADVAKLIALADQDGDGNLSYKELLMTAVNRKLRATEERLYTAFQKFDKDGDGTITKVEIAEVLGIPMADAERLVGEIDQNSDGKIDYEEFFNMMMAKEEGALQDTK